jgi:hypothetical protein
MSIPPQQPPPTTADDVKPRANGFRIPLAEREADRRIFSFMLL